MTVKFEAAEAHNTRDPSKSLEDRNLVLPSTLYFDMMLKSTF